MQGMVEGYMAPRREKNELVIRARGLRREMTLPDTVGMCAVGAIGAAGRSPLLHAAMSSSAAVWRTARQPHALSLKSPVRCTIHLRHVL